ncbi:MAG: hypothetical protein WCW84_11765 [Sulfurimonas sp.]|jgi:hypothetical protein
MRIFLLMVVSAFLLIGCSSKILLPYEEEPLCKRGANEGMCGSVSEVYKKTARYSNGN